MRKLLLTTVVLLVLLLIFGCVCYFMSPPPGAGKEFSEALDIPYPAVIAHRGASGIAPESTILAYELARDMGADYLEADLQRTKDGVIIVFHDDTPARTTNAAEIFPGRENDYIETFTYEELLQLDAGSWFNKNNPARARSEYAGLRIITLKELLDIAESGNNNPGLYLETKAAPRHPGIEEDIVNILRNRGWLHPGPDLSPPDCSLNEKIGASTVNVASGASGVIFQSFHPESLETLRQLAPETPRVLLISLEIWLKNGWKNLLGDAAAMGDGVGPTWLLSWPWNLNKARERVLIVHSYTVNRKWQMRLVRFFGADGIFTDYPEAALNLYKKSDPIDIEIFN